MSLHLPTLLTPLSSAASSSAKATILLHLQCAGHLKGASRAKYLTTITDFSEYCDAKHLPWHASTVKFWLGDRNLTTDKPWATSTMQQKISHVNLLTELSPPLLPGGAVLAARLAPGLGCLRVDSFRPTILPPSFLVTLKNLQQPQLIHLAVQMQALTGLRAGQLSLLTPANLGTQGKLWLAPFKHQQLPAILDIRHVPEWLVRALLLHRQEDYTPILPWTPDQYKAKFKQLTGIYKLPQASHSARHTFASVQKFLNTPASMIGKALTHSAAKTQHVYLHPLSPMEQKVVLENGAYFKPLVLV